MDDLDGWNANGFCGRLRALRHHHRLTLAQVQTSSNGRFTIGSLGGWERGDRVPPVDTLVDLARYYGVTVGYLVAGEGDGLVAPAAPPEVRSAAVGLLIAARLHPDLDPAARAALTTALHAGVPLWDLALATGRTGLELAPRRRPPAATQRPTRRAGRRPRLHRPRPVAWTAHRRGRGPRRAHRPLRRR